MALKNQYRQKTGLNAWVDFQTYIMMIFNMSSPFTTQIDVLLELRAKIIQGCLQVSDQLHALIILGTLPPLYKVIQSSILGSYSDLTTIAFTDIYTHILTE